MNPHIKNSKVLPLVIRGDISGAELELARSMGSDPLWLRAFHRAAIYQFKNNAEAAEANYLAALSDKECDNDVRINFAKFLNGNGRYHEAIPVAKSALEYDRNNSTALGSYLTALLDSAKIDEALKVIGDAPAKLRESKMCQLAMAACERQKGQTDAAITRLNRCLGSYPNDPTVHRMLGDTIGDVSSGSALRYYRTALTLLRESKTSAGARAIEWNMSLHLLRSREFQPGWAYYESGLHKEVGTLGRKLPWQLANLELTFNADLSVFKERWLPVVAEQGIGDQVLFLSALRDLQAEVSKIAVICEERMFQILRRSFPKLELISPGIIEFAGKLDLFSCGYLPLGSLLGRYRASVRDFIAARRPYLTVSKKDYSRTRENLQKLAGGRTIVGLAWKGGYWENQKRNKAIDIKEWVPLFRPDTLVVNLQYGDISEDLDYLRAIGLNMVTFSDLDYKKDLDSWLTISAACDGIVSVSTALVHFAGAVGQKVAVVMPESQGPWIWGIDDQRSISYENVYVFRRKSDESLIDLIRRTALHVK
jgi:ADP-heptose:LPS heptosyltransferase/tetratricopeptide (TPR) repeat protein